MTALTALQRIARALPLVLPLALLAPTLVTAPSTAVAGESNEKQYDHGAKVTIEVRMPDGKIVKHRAEMRSFGTQWRFEFEGADHQHALLLSAEAEEGSKTLEVEIAYERDGSPVIAPFTDTYTAKKRQAFWTEDDSLAIALTFYPTKFERKDTSRDDKEKIKPDDSDDPLGGGGLTLK
ncbi:MAG: hypothetical protein R6X02_25720 [Enhygromyxa sp.]